MTSMILRVALYVFFRWLGNLSTIPLQMYRPSRLGMISKVFTHKKIFQDEVQAECLQFAENKPRPKLDICS